MEAARRQTKVGITWGSREVFTDLNKQKGRNSMIEPSEKNPENAPGRMTSYACVKESR